MRQWEYKTLVYAIEGKVVYSLRFWADPTGKVYGPRERGRLVGSLAQQMRLLEEALKLLDEDGWEVVSVSCAGGFLTVNGVALLRRRLG